MDEFLIWWQHLPENINPVIFEIRSFKLQYYGLMYVIAFAITFFLVLSRIKREKGFEITSDQVKDLTTLMMVGLIIGARLGYVLFYNLSYYLKHPLEIILPFEFSNGITFTGISGMSYHGGLIGIALCAYIFTHKAALSFRQITDLYTPIVPLGYTFGRIGNFINGELFGRVTSSSIGMHFPLAPGPELRHPSQLYEAFFEGIFIFAVLWSIRKIKKPSGAMFAFYLIGYGTVRFFIEYFRQPDTHLGYILLSFTMGQVLCAIMIACGVLLFLFLRYRENTQVSHP